MKGHKKFYLALVLMGYIWTFHHAFFVTTKFVTVFVYLWIVQSTALLIVDAVAEEAGGWKGFWFYAKKGLKSFNELLDKLFGI